LDIEDCELEIKNLANQNETD